MASLENLHDAIHKDKHHIVTGIYKQYLDNTKDSLIHPIFTPSNAIVDNLGLCLVPEHFNALKPLKTTGNGNCLYNAASLAICGKL